MYLILPAIKRGIRALTAIPKLAVALMFLASLAFSIATLTVTSVYKAASAALSGMGIVTVAAREAGEKMALQRSLQNAERKAAQEAADKLAVRSSLEQAERKAAQEAREKLALRQSLERSERVAATRHRQTEAVRAIGLDTAERAKHRAQRSAARNISSAAGEAIPFVGVAVIAGALAFEVRDACQTARDMAGFEAALLSDTDPQTEREAAMEAFDCAAMIREEIPTYEDVPSKEEIWKEVLSAPGKAWERAKEIGMDLENYNWSGLTELMWESSIKQLIDRLFDSEPTTP